MKTILFHISFAGVLLASALYAESSSSTGTNAIAKTANASARYRITDLGTFGGNFSIAFGINNAGRVGGAAALANGNVHPFITGVGGIKYDLGTLGGPNAQANVPNWSDGISIVSETSKPDPLKEDFCGFGSHLVCLGAVFNGVMTPLPTLGGNNAMVLFQNSRGQMAGVAENSTHDPSCPAPQVLAFQAATWGVKGDVQVLPPLPGDTVGFALGINNRGQAVGSSGTCANTVVSAVGLFVGPHAVLWDNGSATDLGSLGGTMGKAGAINDRGEVAGFSSLPGDTAVHSFLWTKNEGMLDLGGLGTDYLSDPAGINNSTQVVGGSCDTTGNCRAFLWEKKVLSDLNDLIAADSPWYLLYALGINDAGEIVGFALEKATGDVHAYLATPAPGQPVTQTAKSAVNEGFTERRQVALPESVRTMFRSRLPFGTHAAR